MKFRETLIKAAEEANKAGEISSRDLFRIRLATALRPFAVAKVEKEMAQQALSAGVLPAGGADDLAAIDWAALLEFIKALLPVILEIIALF